MSLELKSVHVRLDAEAREALRMVADVRGHDLGEAARHILTEALLGKAHAIKKVINSLAKGGKP